MSNAGRLLVAATTRFVSALLVGYGMSEIVLIQNSFASRIVEVQEDRRTIETGLYSVVRHPMYPSSLIMCLATPIVLGSCFALVSMLLLPFFFRLRINDEEKALSDGLEGYVDYMKKARCRLIPWVW